MTLSDVPAPIVWRESAVLSVFGSNCAIKAIVKNNSCGDIFRKGYHDGWRDFSAKGRRNAEVFEVFDSRARKYAEAEVKEQSISLPLTSFLAASVGISLERLFETKSPEIATRVGYIGILAEFLLANFDTSFLVTTQELTNRCFIEES